MTLGLLDRLWKVRTDNGSPAQNNPFVFAEFCMCFCMGELAQSSAMNLRSEGNIINDLNPSEIWCRVRTRLWLIAANVFCVICKRLSINENYFRISQLSGSL